MTAGSYPARVSELLGDRGFLVYARGGGSSELIETLFAEVEKPNGTYVIWVGHVGGDDPSEVVANIRSMTESLPSHRYLIVAPIQGNWTGHVQETQILGRNSQINKLLQSAFGGNVVSIEKYIECADYLDNIHLKSAGDLTVAEHVAAEVARRGW